MTGGLDDATRGTSVRKSAFEREGKTGNHQDDRIRYGSDLLVDFADEIAKAPAEFIGRNYTAADLIGDENDRTRRGTQSCAEPIDVRLKLDAVVAAGFQKL